jgi:hypothetical protein
MIDYDHFCTDECLGFAKKGKGGKKKGKGSGGKGGY